MALSKSITTPHGVNISDAYIRATNIQLHDKTLMTFGLCSYAVNPNEHPDVEPISSDVVSAPYNLDGVNPFEQAYLYLKTLPDFTNAVDC